MKIYPYIVIAAPGYSANITPIYSHHDTLAAAKRAVGKSDGSVIVERPTRRDETRVMRSAILDAGWTMH